MPRDLVVPAVVSPARRPYQEVRYYLGTNRLCNHDAYTTSTITARWTKRDRVWCKFPADIWCNCMRWLVLVSIWLEFQVHLTLVAKFTVPKLSGTVELPEDSTLRTGIYFGSVCATLWLVCVP